MTGAVHVAAIELSVSKHGRWVRVSGIVTVHDQHGQPVGKATVYATWSVTDAGEQSTSAGTNGRGRASFKLRSDTLSTGHVVVLAVDDIEAVGCVYDPASNVVDTVEIVVP